MCTKLFKVQSRGVTSNFLGTALGLAYAIAETPTEAYLKVRSEWAKPNPVTSKERELVSIELIAEDDDFPSCGTRLHT